VGVDAFLREHFGELSEVMDAISAELWHVKGLVLLPNPSAFTATTAIAVGIPARAAAWLFISGRLDAWAKLITI
jgi:citrate synthase